ncbi:MAG: hypothetical protein QXT77_09145 [Candidatus Methanomethylicaceae archaeon]
MQRARNWCFTWNNYTVDSINQIAEAFEDDDIQYVVYGKEVGEQGTPHLQGYVEFVKPMTLGGLKKLFGNVPHWEQRKGTREQAIKYCMKDEDYVTMGEPKRGAKLEGGSDKNKMLPFLEMLREGKLQEVAAHPDCSFSVLKHVMTAAPLFEKARDDSVPMNVRWYWGPTGTGKTRRAYWEARQLGGDVYIKSTNSKWFDGYDGQKIVIFDDLRSSWFEYSYLLKLLDRYPTRVECKGGSRQWLAETIYVTSPFRPDEMYDKMQERDQDRDSIAQLVRRVTCVEHMPMTPFGGWTPPETVSLLP